MHTHLLAAKVVQLPQGMISDHETGSYHCCLLDLSELHGGRSYGSGAWNAHQLVTTYASESGSFSSACVFCALRKKPVPHLPQGGGEDVVGLVFPTLPHLFSNSIKVGREAFRG